MTEDLTHQQRADARLIFEGKVSGTTACYHCAGIHDRVAGLDPWRQPCPRVKKAVWHPDGTLLEVEYWSSRSDWDADVVFPRNVYDTADAELVDTTE